MRNENTGRAKWTQPYIPKPPQTPANTSGKSVDVRVAKTQITSTDLWVIYNPKTKKVDYRKIADFDAAGDPIQPAEGCAHGGRGCGHEELP